MSLRDEMENSVHGICSGCSRDIAYPESGMRDVFKLEQCMLNELKEKFSYWNGYDEVEARKIASDTAQMYS